LLTAYLSRTIPLLQILGAFDRVYRDGRSRRTFNQARGSFVARRKLAATSAPFRLTWDPDYNFSSIGLGSGNGLAGVLNHGQMLYAVASGYSGYGLARGLVLAFQDE